MDDQEFFKVAWLMAAIITGVAIWALWPSDDDDE